MAQLVLSLNGKIIGEFPLNKERLSIGRSADNDIQIDNLAVSGHHALILTILNDSFLEDLNSTNGTFVNGKPVKKYALRDGDIVTLGKHELKYLNDQATQESDFEKTVVIRPSTTGEAGTVSMDSVSRAVDAGGLNDQPSGIGWNQDEGKMPLAKLQILNGPFAGKELELTKALTTVGKPGVQVAAISRRPQGYFIIHVESKNGDHPVVNGSSIGQQAHALKHEDTIEIAGTRMGFFIKE
jgi:pSer/pThr/pTyr-binding forkhead associated (FHA) protein